MLSDLTDSSLLHYIRTWLLTEAACSHCEEKKYFKSWFWGYLLKSWLKENDTIALCKVGGYTIHDQNSGQQNWKLSSLY